MRAGPTENGELRVQGPLVRSFGCLAPINPSAPRQESMSTYGFTSDLPTNFTRKPPKSLDLRASFARPFVTTLDLKTLREEFYERLCRKGRPSLV